MELFSIKIRCTFQLVSTVTFNCFVKTGWHEDMERNIKFGGFFEGLVEKP